MKAIVLTYDKYRAVTEHMVWQYGRLWVDHPFCFRIPYQELPGENSEQREYVQSPADIRGTVLTLLRDLDDEEWIYWCIDDKYPITLELPRIRKILEWVEQGLLECDGILFCRCRNMLTESALRTERLQDKFNHIYLRRKNYEQIWIHQFVRVKVIRHLFEQMPDAIGTAKVMDHLKEKVVLPESHRLFVTERNLAVFGESTSRGKLTANCYRSLLAAQLPLPEIAVAEEQHIVMGEIRDWGYWIKRLGRRVKRSLFQPLN
jgi:hypothetical protein